MTWPRRLLNLLRPARLARDIDREMDFHLQERIDELVESGMEREVAAREAARRFGHRTGLRERTRDVDILGWLESMLADLRYAWRALRASPGFTAVAVLSLGLGIGANSAIFSLVNALLLRPVPVPEPERLIQLVNGETNTVFTNPLWEAIRDGGHPAPLLAVSTTPFNLAAGGEVRRTLGAWVSGSFFSVLGVRPAAGRLLESGDDVRGCGAVAVVSDGFADREFGGAREAVGRRLTLDGQPFTVIGVVEPRFFGLEVGRAVQVYAPLCSEALIAGPNSLLDRRSGWFLSVMGRLPDGLSLDAASARLSTMAPSVFEATVPAHWGPDDQRWYRNGTLSARPAVAGLSDLRPDYGEALVVLMVIVGVVLLIACANLAHLLLARSAARRPEFAVRLAIGAGRGRLLRQLLTESLLLAGAGAVVGLVFARWASSFLVSFLSTRTFLVWLDLSLDWRVLGFTAAVATATGLLFGMVPAWRATRVDPHQAMKPQGRGQSAGPGRGARVLVVAQVALSMVLLAGSGLLLNSFRRLLALDPGFDPTGVLLVEADLGNTGYPPDRQRQAHRTLLDRLRAVPGVRSASASFTTPLGSNSWNDRIVVEGYQPADEEDRTIWFNSVSDGWFATLGAELIAGRDIEARDGGSGPPVAVVSESMARRFYRDGAPLGRTFRLQGSSSLGPPITIVGVVRDAKYQSLRERPQPVAYVPLSQGEWYGTAVRYQLRSSGSSAALIPSVTSVMAEESAAITVEFSTLSEQVMATLRRPRLLATLSGFFGGLALVLAVVGLYGTIAYGVARRRNEIGIRLALGAARPRVMGMVLGEAGSLVAVGVVLGLLGAAGVTRLVASFLFGVSPTDPATLAMSAVLLSSVALAAALVPAWRAARLDPTETLRQE